MGTGKEQALAYDVVVDGVAGFFFEFAHHVVLAEIVFPGKGFDGEVFGQIVVDVAEKLLCAGRLYTKCIYEDNLIVKQDDAAASTALFALPSYTQALAPKRRDTFLSYPLFWIPASVKSHATKNYMAHCNMLPQFSAHIASDAACEGLPSLL